MTSDKLAPARPGNKTTPFVGLLTVTALIDMLGWYWSYGLSDAEQRLFEAMVGKRIINRRSKHGGWTVRIPTPHQHLGTFLKWLAQRGIPANLVHVAFDFKFAEEVPGDTWAPATRALYLARSHLVMHAAPYAERLYKDAGGDFYVKSFARPQDADGKPIGPRRRSPARFAYAYPKARDTLRIEPRFFGRANVEKHLPPLHAILDTDPREIFNAHMRWRNYKPRLLATAIKKQEAFEERQWMLGKRTRKLKALTGIWPRLLLTQSHRIANLTVTQPLNLDEVPFQWA